MNLEYYYWYFKSAIPPKICDDIIKYGKSQQEQLALTGGFEKKIIEGEELTNKEIKDLSKKRKSNVVWMTDRWIYKEIQPFVDIANVKANWNFDWDWSEHIQFAKYGLNQHYGWHCDSAPTPYKNVPDGMKGKIRKLSVTVCLSDPEDYDGGELEFDLRNSQDYEHDKSSKTICSEIKQKGSIVVFPSFLWHRVKPVTKGTRYSLVMWNLGKPWR